MKLNSVWTSIVYFFDVLTFQPTHISDEPALQKPLDATVEPAIVVEPANIQPVHPHVKPADAVVVSLDNEDATADDGRAYFLEDGTPIVPTPKNIQESSSRLNCQYPRMTGFQNCHGPKSRDCWLVNKGTGKTIDINTDYEDEDEIPYGIVRKFYLEVGEEPIRPDRVTFEHGKIFNRTYPGPWLEACWGDWLEVTVKNTLRWNGTSIHWHGFRQLNTNHQDGVNGVTECPIAPGDTYTYRFRAMQYGSAWYHSHYGLQYGDGTLGPITIYGPETANYETDLDFRPILMTDWNHRSVFEDWPLELVSGNAPQMTNILLNGTGQFGPGSKPEDKYQILFEKGRRHKLILINTSVDTIFVFSIDHHKFEVIEMDFVPIKPYVTASIKIGIGQRYHIIVQGKDDPWDDERDANYWMRTTPARKCAKFVYGPDDQSGIIRYNTTMPKNVQPLSEPKVAVDISCMDEKKEDLIPWVGWRVGNPVNIDPNQRDMNKIPLNKRYIFDVAMHESKDFPYEPSDPRLRWAMHTAPFRINFSDPTILALDREDELNRQPWLDIITYGPKTDDHWIWMVITGPSIPLGGGKQRQFFPAAHPMHLHGHDFAILYQTDYPWYDDFEAHNPMTGFYREFPPDKLNCANPRINCNNPARRDVVMLPAGGFVIIAFKADNPGAWIFHCHIAFHASSGLAMQIIENKHLIPETNKKDMPEIKKRCENWDKWVNNPYNLWDQQHPEGFQDDSGV